jgi:hypothetical protein
MHKLVGAQLAQARVEEGGVHKQKVSQPRTELAAIRRRGQRREKRVVQGQQGAHIDIASKCIEQVALARSLIAAAVLGKGERNVKEARRQTQSR